VVTELLQTALRASISGLYALTPDASDSEKLAARVAAAIAGGARAVQYRNKAASPELRLEQARALRMMCRDRATLFIVNDDVELARLVDADGVHLGKDDASVAMARARLGPSAIVGVSCYDELERGADAVDAGADYIAFGSFFSSAVKPAAVRAKPSLLTAAKSRWRVPVVAIGGITAANAASLIDAGADAVAVISAVFGAGDVESAARRIARLFKGAAVRNRDEI
jgi:thiamine-phosphate pyrophosphorylase